MKASDFKEVERKDGITYIRWDAIPEIVSIPARKKGREPAQKESGYVICSELVVDGCVDKKKVKAVIDKDLAIRYPEGERPRVKVDLSTTV